MARWRVGPGNWAEAVATTEGAQLVLAGAGTGKTEFLVRRAVHLISSSGAQPHEVLALAFSRRAASELRHRIEEGLGRSAVNISASTFHSFAYRLAEHVGPSIGWRRLPNLLTGPEHVAFVASLLGDEDPAAWPLRFRDLLATATFASEVAEFILRAREQLIQRETLEALASDRPDWQALPGFMERYDRALADHDRIDYGTLQARALDMVRGALLDYRYVLVDEYQDTTLAQARLVEALSGPHGNITVAADPGQSIYGFRGARPGNVAEVTKKFPATTTIVLDTSFRVPEPVLAAAQRLLESTGQQGISSVPAPQSGSVEVTLFDQHTHEAEWIAAEIERLHTSEGVPYRSIAVLVRTKRRLLTELSRALARRGIPHDRPEARLADTPAVRAVLDCVEACELQASDPQAADRAMARLLLGSLFVTPVGAYTEMLRSRARGLAWADIVEVQTADGGGLARLLRSDDWTSKMPADEGFWTWWTELPQLAQFAEGESGREHRAAWSSLSQVLARLTERDPAATLRDYAELASVEGFEATPLLSYRRVSEDRITLATLHQSKGLEFDIVFIADAVEGVFPDLRRERSILQSHLLGAEHPEDDALRERLADELRLAYVGMTRASSRVVWTATLAGIDEGQFRPSRFLPLVAGCQTAAELRGPRAAEPAPTTPRAAQAFLRRIMVDPGEPPARRLASAAVLATASGLRPIEHFAGVRPSGPDRGLVPSSVRLSPSQATLYEQCPLRYVLTRRLRIGESESVYSRFGSLMHAVLEQAERDAIPLGAPHATLEAALAILDRSLPDYDFGSPGQTEAWRGRGREFLERLYGQWPPGEGRPVSIERELTMELAGTKWLGYADRVEVLPDGSGRVVDYKTSTRAPPPSEVELQLGFYALAASADAGLSLDISEAQAWYPLAGQRRPRVIDLDVSELVGIQDRLTGIAEGIKSEEWTPRPNEACDRCPVRILCPEWPEGQEAFVP